MEIDASNSMITIKDLVSTEVDLEIYLSWLRDVAGNPFIESARADYSMLDLVGYLSDKLNRSDVKFWGIFTKFGRFIGTVKLDPIDRTRGTAWLGIMIGDHSQRGKGYGFLVLEHVFQYAISHGLKEIFLGVDKNNLHAIKLYERSGFKIVSENEISYVMEKHLKLSTNFK
jgi:RimJ/RimL family protein N-acetyltransferase